MENFLCTLCFIFFQKAGLKIENLYDYELKNRYRAHILECVIDLFKRSIRNGQAKYIVLHEVFQELKDCIKTTNLKFGEI